MSILPTRAGLATLLLLAFISNNIASPNFSDSLKTIDSIVKSIDKLSGKK